MPTQDGLNPDEMKFDTEEQPYDAELDRVRRQWRLDREMVVSDFPGLPIRVRLSRYMETGESGPPAYIGYDADEPEPRQPILLIATQFLDTKRGVLKLVASLALKYHLGNEEMAWSLANHVQDMLNVERERWLGDWKKEEARAAALVAKRDDSIRQLSGADPSPKGFLGFGVTDEDEEPTEFVDGRREPGIRENG